MKSASVSPKLLLMVGLLLPVGLLLMDMQRSHSFNQGNGQPEQCQSTPIPDATVSRDQLALFLTVPERDTKAKVQDILKAPYCQLPSLQVRADATAERVAYPLAFDPQTWLIVLYEGDEYAGYQFSFETF